VANERINDSFDYEKTNIIPSKYKEVGNYMNKHKNKKILSL
jgi:hypothetical protein